MTETTKKPLSLKLDEGDKMQLKILAKKDNRTLHGLIVHVLKNYIYDNKTK